MLNDRELKKLALEKELVTPFVEENCKGATIDLTLHHIVKRYSSKDIIVVGEKQNDDKYEEFDLLNNTFELQPNASVLVRSNESFKVPDDMAATILERYSVKLLGLTISPASYMNPGYEGTMTFMATNVNSVPIRLTAGIKFAQLALHRLSSPAELPYVDQTPKYLGSKSVEISKLHLDDEIQLFLKEKGVSDVSKETAHELGNFLMRQIKDAAKDIGEELKRKLAEASR